MLSMAAEHRATSPTRDLAGSIAATSRLFRRYQGSHRTLQPLLNTKESPVNLQNARILGFGTVLIAEFLEKTRFFSRVFPFLVSANCSKIPRDRA